MNRYRGNYQNVNQMNNMECGSCNNMSKQQLLYKIDQVSLAAYDTLLYLDTHPYDEEALAYYCEMLMECKEYKKMFSEQYYPLGMEYACGTDSWSWGCAPNPWEMEAN